MYTISSILAITMLSLSVICTFRVNRVFFDFQDLTSFVPTSLYQVGILLPPSTSQVFKTLLKNIYLLLDTLFPDYPSILTYKMNRTSYKASLLNVVSQKLYSATSG